MVQIYPILAIPLAVLFDKSTRHY